MGRQNTVSFMI